MVCVLAGLLVAYAAMSAWLLPGPRDPLTTTALGALGLAVALVYPFFEGIAWNHHFGVQAWLQAHFGAEFHDFAGSIVVHAVGGWIGLAAVLLLGARRGRRLSERHGGQAAQRRPRPAAACWRRISRV